MDGLISLRDNLERTARSQRKSHKALKNKIQAFAIFNASRTIRQPKLPPELLIMLIDFDCGKTFKKLSYWDLLILLGGRI